jgi:hypothetical protein
MVLPKSLVKRKRKRKIIAKSAEQPKDKPSGKFSIFFDERR